MTDISPQSIIEPGAQIADDVCIGPFCYIGPDVVIGEGCRIHNSVTLVGHTGVGRDTEIFPMTVVGIPLDGEPSRGRCEIGNANSLREHVTIYAGTAKKPTRLGDDNLVMIASQIGASARVGDHGIFANCTHIGSGAVIEDYVRTSGFSFIDDHAHLGAYSFTAGYTHVDHDAPPYAMLQGSPFRVRGVNSHNLKQCGFGEDDIRELKNIFREVFNGAGNCNPEAVEKLRQQRKTTPAVKSLLKYLDAQSQNQ